MDPTKPTFLTSKKIDKKLLLKTLTSQIQEIENSEDKKILELIIRNFKKEDYSLLTTQEISYLNNNTPDIYSDYLLFRYKFKTYQKEHMVSNYPIHLAIEPVSACNLRCIMCFQSDESFSSNSQFMGKMDFDLFKKIIDEANIGKVGAITLASRGEPTLHPDLSKMLQYCSKKFFELKLNTNATRLDEKLIHQILESSVTDVVFSIDSYTKEDYESIRIKGIFEEVYDNIKKFSEIKRDHYPDSITSTRVSGVKVNSNQDPNSFKRFWEKYVDYVVMVEMEPWWDTYNNSTEIAGKQPCNYLWQRMNIWYDGLCNPCDVDYKSKLAVGSVKEKSIHEIWAGEKYNKLRQAHLLNQRNNCFPCDRCPIGT